LNTNIHNFLFRKTFFPNNIENIFIWGKPVQGKVFGLQPGHQACGIGHKNLYLNLIIALLKKLWLLNLKNHFVWLLNQLEKVSLLILDLYEVISIG
jgi:hypothetical protein